MADSHVHDDRYMTRDQLRFGQSDVAIGAVRTKFGEQKKWFIRDGYAVVLPYADILANAELIIQDGGELTLVG